MNIKLSKSEKIRIDNSYDLYPIMQSILLREEKIDQDREHFWTVALDTAFRLLNIELIGMGTVNSVIAEPMEVFSVPLQKRAVRLICVHNHPSGELKPSESDIDVTDRLIQVGKIIKVEVEDHLIITDTSYYSFKDNGYMEKLADSLKYVPPYQIQQEYMKKGIELGEKKGIKNNSRDIARKLRGRGMSVEEIAIITGMEAKAIKKLKVVKGENNSESLLD